MHLKLLDRKKWKIWIEPANAIFEGIEDVENVEGFYNRRREHSSLEYATPHDCSLARTPRALTTAASERGSKTADRSN